MNSIILNHILDGNNLLDSLSLASLFYQGKNLLAILGNLSELPNPDIIVKLETIPVVRGGHIQRGIAIKNINSCIIHPLFINIELNENIIFLGTF